MLTRVLMYRSNVTWLTSFKGENRKCCSTVVCVTVRASTVSSVSFPVGRSVSLNVIGVMVGL